MTPGCFLTLLCLLVGRASSSDNIYDLEYLGSLTSRAMFLKLDEYIDKESFLKGKKLHVIFTVLFLL